MKKLGLSLPALGLVIILLVSACGSGKATTPTPTVVPTEVPALDPTAAPTESTEAQPTPTLADPSEPVSVTPPDEPGYCEAAPLPELPVRPVDDTDWAKGADAANAEITLIEYSDFQCPGCSGMSPVVDAFVAANPNVRLVYRHFPLDFHPYALITAEAAEAAGAQGKFWEMHDLLFDQQASWSVLSEVEVRSLMSTYAKELNLDIAVFDAALDEGTYKEKVQSQYAEAIDLDLPGTPSFIFNNVLFPSDIGLSMQGMQSFMGILESKATLFFDAPPELTIDVDATYEAVLHTSKGDLRVNLLPESAPTMVNSFVFLTKERWYNGSNFFFVRDNFVAVTGDPTNSTVGYPGYYCAGEEQGTFDRAGLVGMLSNGQFFITLGSDALQLDGQFALIGQVVEGLDVLDELNRVVVGDSASPMPDILDSMEIVE